MTIKVNLMKPVKNIIVKYNYEKNIYIFISSTNTIILYKYK